MQRETRSTAETDPTGAPTCSTSDACECGYLDGVAVTITDTDTATGCTRQRTFQKPSRSLVCPRCGGRNDRFRRSYVAHVASVARSHGRRYGVHKGTTWDVCLTLDTEAADAADVGASGSAQVWFDRLWPRLRKRLTRADSEAKYIGTASAQVATGRYHFHLVLFTSLHGHEIRQLLHGDAGVNAHVQPPKPNESNERFAARRAAYAWDNAERAVRAAGGNGPSFRFTASRGTGYDSANAKERRRDAVRGDKDSEDPSSALVEEHGQDGTRGEENDASSGAREQQTDGEEPPDNAETPTVPPVDYGKDGEPLVVSAYTDAVRRVSACLTSYVGSRVHVRGVGLCRVLSVGVASLEGSSLAVTVHPVDAERTVDVPWTRIHCTNAPTLRTVSPKPPTSKTSETMNDRTDEQSTEEDDAVARFTAAARYSTVTIVQPDGSRVRTRKDHETGEMTETVLPPEDA